MRKLVLAAAILAGSFAGFADDGSGRGSDTRVWLPLGLSILTPPVQLPSPGHTVFGGMVNLGYGQVKNLAIVDVGIVNNVIEFFGGERINWVNVNSSYWANMAVMVIYIVWNALPFKILVLLGGLQSINKQYYDAAKVDGTPRRRVLTHITVPLLSPMLAYVVITGFIGGFKEYSSIIGIFGETRGPADMERRLNTMVGFIYDALETNKQGHASAAALILFAIILVVTLINTQVSKKRVHY